MAAAKKTAKKAASKPAMKQGDDSSNSSKKGPKRTDKAGQSGFGETRMGATTKAYGKSVVAGNAKGLEMYPTQPKSRRNQVTSNIVGPQNNRQLASGARSAAPAQTRRGIVSSSPKGKRTDQVTVVPMKKKKK